MGFKMGPFEIKALDMPEAMMELADRYARLLAVARAAEVLCKDEESEEGGWGPDVTMLMPLKAALAAVEDLL